MWHARGLCHDGCARMAGHGNNKKMIIVSRGRRSHGGYFFWAPGSPPSWCSVFLCPLFCVLRSYWSATRRIFSTTRVGFLHLIGRLQRKHGATARFSSTCHLKITRHCKLDNILPSLALHRSQHPLFAPQRRLCDGLLISFRPN